MQVLEFEYLIIYYIKLYCSRNDSGVTHLHSGEAVKMSTTANMYGKVGDNANMLVHFYVFEYVCGLHWLW